MTDPQSAPMGELIARLEAAAESDRYLDGDIAAAIGIDPAGFERQDRQWLWLRYIPSSVPDFDSWEAPFFTSSIDAALTLVPEEQSSNFEVCLEQHKRRTRTYWAVIIGHMYRDAWVSKAPTAPIALCIAALKARYAVASNVRGGEE